MGDHHPYYRANSPAPDVAGVGLKAEHFTAVLEKRPALGFFEVHPENYMCPGGPLHRYLDAIRQDYPLSLHGVAASLGSERPVPQDHLDALKTLVDRYEPFVVSEHLAWSATEGEFLADLLPLPYTGEALAIMADNVERMQDALERPILVENPSTYLTFRDNDMSEPAFLAELCKRTGCGLLLDVNNVYVCARNHGFDPAAYFDEFPFARVGEIHLAGHAIDTVDGAAIRVDDHGSAICEDVWALYRDVLGRAGPVPTLIERDANLPPAEELWAEATRASDMAKKIGTGTGRRDRVA